MLAKLDAVVKKDEGDTEAHLKNLAESQSGDESDGERMVAEIEKCCFEWRAGLVVPRWVVLFEKKNLDGDSIILLFHITISDGFVFSLWLRSQDISFSSYSANILGTDLNPLCKKVSGEGSMC